MTEPLDKRKEYRLENGLPRETCATIWEAGFASHHVWDAQRRDAGPAANVPAPANPFRKSMRVPHDYDDLAVSRMALLMMDRLAQKRAEGAHGWDDPGTSHDSIAAALARSVAKRRWIDVANYAMFLYMREEKQ